MTDEEHRQIDCEVASEILGWRQVRRHEGEYSHDYYGYLNRFSITLDRVPYFTRNIYNAMTVAHTVVGQGASFSIWMTPSYSSVFNTAIAAFRTGVYPPDVFDKNQDNTFLGASLPGDLDPSLAICKAALKWLDNEKRKVNEVRFSKE